MKRVVSTLLALSAALAVFAAPAKGPYKIIFVNALVGHPVYNQQDEGVKAAVKDIGAKVVDVQIVGASDTNGLSEKGRSNSSTRPSP